MKQLKPSATIRRILPIAAFALAAFANADHYACSNDVPNLIGSIVRTDDAGNIVASFGQGVLSYPISIAFDSKGVLFVGDYQAGTVERFLPDGTYLGEFANVQDGMGSIVFHPDGSLLVARYDGGTIWRFASDGTQMDDYVANDGLSRHGQMVFDPAGNLYVTSWVDNVINRYDADGNPLGAFSSFAKSGIDGVVGMAFDTSGQMYVSEYANHKIKLLDADGFFVSDIATTFGEIEYLTMGEDGNLFVPYFFNQTIHRFAPDGTDLGEFAPILGSYQIVKGPLFYLPESITRVRGRIDAGDVNSLAAVDGDVLRVCRFVVLNSTEPPIQINVQSTSGVADPSSLTVHLTSKMATSGLFQQDLIMIDETGNLSPIRRTDTTNLTMKTVSLSADVPSTYVAADGNIKIRYNVRQVGPTASFIWCHAVDHVVWTVVP